MEANLTIEGVKYMFLGMTTVFLFLAVLIYILKLQTKLFNKLFPLKELPVMPAKRSSGKTSSEPDEEEIIAVITAAITEYRKG